MASVITALALLMLALGGCTAPATPQAEGWYSVVRYASDKGSTLTVQVEPAQAMEAGGSPIATLRLTFTLGSSDGSSLQRVMHADAAPRNVLTGPLFHFSPDVQPYLTYRAEGSLLPMGIGWRPQIVDGGIAAIDGYNATRIAALETTANRFTFETAGYHDYSDMPFPVEVDYAGNRVFPKTLWAGDEEWTRIEATGPFEPDADMASRRRPDAPLATPVFAIFPGEDQDVWKMGYTPRQAVDWLVQQEPTVQGILDNGGCVSQAIFRFPRALGQGPLGLVNTTIAEISLTVRDAASNAVAWDFRYEKNPLTAGFTEPMPEEDPWPTDCNLRRGTMASVLDFKERVQSLPPTHDHAPDSFLWWMQTRRSGDRVHGEETAGIYALDYRPDHVTCPPGNGACSYSPDQMSMRATNLRLFDVEGSLPFLRAYGGRPNSQNQRAEPVRQRQAPADARAGGAEEAYDTHCRHIADVTLNKGARW